MIIGICWQNIYFILRSKYLTLHCSRDFFYIIIRVELVFNISTLYLNFHYSL